MQRRDWLLACAAASTLPAWAAAAPDGVWRKTIPSSGEAVPVVGLGTWLTFDVGDDPLARARVQQVLARFVAAGGGVVDSSPMYGSAERVVGDLLATPELAPHAARVFTASKIWTPFEVTGRAQLAESLRLWRVARMDLMQVHNLLATDAHLKTLRAARDAGRVRLIGITTSHGRRHDEVARLLRREPLDVLQITYNPADRSAEPLLDLAAERGVAVIVNRPFDGGDALRRLAGRPLPAWARDELGVQTWAAFVLKWEVSHPAVTCAIPATRNPVHCDENMAALHGPRPTPAQRRRMGDVLAQACARRTTRPRRRQWVRRTARDAGATGKPARVRWQAWRRLHAFAPPARSPCPCTASSCNARPKAARSAWG
ncbi:aldo/keto reductase [Azohydromonas sediminis]|uniref:aldo/keto reductase n=1 Tax=Azohydromonas sediminis TaxID=2259674 RepID=UPI000E65D893|nr:aldo/keto reductase [Azohydromonas sediminis]